MIENRLGSNERVEFFYYSVRCSVLAGTTYISYGTSNSDSGHWSAGKWQ